MRVTHHRRLLSVFRVNMELIERAGLQVKTPLPAEITTEKVNNLKTFRTGPGYMAEIDYLGHTGKIPVGSSGQDRVLPVPDSAGIHRRDPAADQEGGDPEHVSCR